jgi:HAMP domain-containing protein
MDPALARLPTIGRRLSRLVVLVVGLSLAAMAALSLLADVQRFWTGKRETMLTTARLFAAATSGDVAAGRADGVVQTLRAVARIPGLLRVEVLDPRGRLIAELGEASYLASDPVLADSADVPLLALLRSATVQVVAPVIQGTERVGQVRVLVGTDELPAQLLALLGRTAAVSAAILAFGLVLALRLQRSITAPLGKLAAAMAAPGRENTYGPVPEDSRDRETRQLAGAFNAMVGRIRGATQAILDREMEIIARLSRAAEQRDDQTGQHVIRVAAVSRIIAEALKLDPDAIEDLVRASPMHDVGKIAVPDAILFKPGRLDPDERRQMEEHAQKGFEVLSGSQSPLVALAAEIALTHHERWDGTGYPRRLRGAEIPLCGRITAVADVCDALLSERPYKKPWTPAQVRAFLQENSGTHFDPACVAALLDHWRGLEEVYSARPN